MEDWTRIPRDKMITVSRRKYMRLKASVSWKLEAKHREELRKAKESAALGWKQAEIYQHQHLTQMANENDWMERYLAASKELAELKQSLTHMV